MRLPPRWGPDGQKVPRTREASHVALASRGLALSKSLYAPRPQRNEVPLSTRTGLQEHYNFRKAQTVVDSGCSVGVALASAHPRHLGKAKRVHFLGGEWTAGRRGTTIGQTRGSTPRRLLHSPKGHYRGPFRSGSHPVEVARRVGVAVLATAALPLHLHRLRWLPGERSRDPR